MYRFPACASHEYDSEPQCVAEFDSGSSRHGSGGEHEESCVRTMALLDTMRRFRLFIGNNRGKFMLLSLARCLYYIYRKVETRTTTGISTSENYDLYPRSPHTSDSSVPCGSLCLSFRVAQVSMSHNTACHGLITRCFFFPQVKLQSN